MLKCFFNDELLQNGGTEKGYIMNIFYLGLANCLGFVLFFNFSHPFNGRKRAVLWPNL